MPSLVSISLNIFIRKNTSLEVSARSHVFITDDKIVSEILFYDFWTILVHGSFDDSSH